MRHRLVVRRAGTLHHGGQPRTARPERTAHAALDNGFLRPDDSFEPERTNAAIIGQNVAVGSGKRAAPRRAAKRPSRLRPSLLALAAGVTLAVVAWGYLVYAAIDFGSSARGGESAAWGFLALASVGAVACLFVALMLIPRLMHRLREHGTSATSTPTPPDLPRPLGGRRASR